MHTKFHLLNGKDNCHLFHLKYSFFNIEHYHQSPAAILIVLFTSRLSTLTLVVHHYPIKGRVKSQYSIRPGDCCQLNLATFFNIYHQSILPKPRSFTASEGAKAAVLPKAGLPPQTQEPRLQFYQGWIGSVASRCFPQLSLTTEHNSARCGPT